MRSQSRKAGIGLLCCVAACLWPAFGAGAEEPGVRAIAVTLNYCRASFHRLRRNPSKRVMLEEQSKILNNLNLNAIGAQEVITLYTAVLDEIGREQIADKERAVIAEGYQRAVRQELLSHAFVLGAQVSTTQYGAAIRTGCSSWWDYRSLGMNRDIDLWKVDKARMGEVVDKSSRFLDTFWKLAQQKSIPDSWLVRDDDLEKLEAALAETSPAVRLRVLQRMERFMQCYPPYWYHVGRTQQALGQLFAASETYVKLTELGAGHFRKDEMLAAALANQAAIQMYLHQPAAPQTARKALEFSNGVWQANLVCARVLSQSECPLEAEDAILRNLDVDLEHVQSLASLVALYCATGNQTGLASRLTKVDQLSSLPPSLLLEAAVSLSPNKLPAAAQRQLALSLFAHEHNQFGKPQLVLVAASAWDLENATLRLVCGEKECEYLKSVKSRGQTLLYFSVPSPPRSSSASGATSATLDLHISTNGETIRLGLKRLTWSRELLEQAAKLATHEGETSEFWSRFTPKRRQSFLITELEMDSSKVLLSYSDPVTKGAPAILEVTTRTATHPAATLEVEQTEPVEEEGQEAIEIEKQEPRVENEKNE